MKGEPTDLPGVMRVSTRVWRDERGWFRESWQQARYAELGIAGPFVQDNVSCSHRGVVRGLHYQHPHAQGKLVSVLAGAAWDVVVDVRAGSPHFGRWTAVELSAENGVQLWIPPGFAHGFAALSDGVVLAYRCTQPYHPEAERTLLWNDPALGLAWPVEDARVSGKDAGGVPLAQMPAEWLPPYPGG